MPLPPNKVTTPSPSPPADPPVDLSVDVADLDVHDVPNDVQVEDLLGPASLNLLSHSDDFASPDPEPCSCCSRPIGSCPVYISSMLEIIFQLDKSGLPNQDGLRIPLANSNLSYSAWNCALDGYFDKIPILDAVRFGWDLSLVGDPNPSDAKRNHPSSLNHPADTQSYIDKELAHGCLLGPILSAPFSVACSPLGSVPKEGSSTRRTITDCSFNGRGINRWIPQQWYRGSPFKILLPGTADIVSSIRKVQALYPGEQILGFKMDLSRYYRNLWIDPGQARHLGIRWNGSVYLDLVFSFGNRAAMVAAQRMAEGLSWSFRTKISPDGLTPNSGLSCSCVSKCDCGSNNLTPYVDDFIGVAPASQAAHLWDALVGLVHQLGLRPSSTPGHICPPSTSFIGLGVKFDLVANTASLPPAKLASIKAMVALWREKHSASRQELQQLLGKLLHASRVVRPGRLHVARMLDTLRRAYILSSPVPLDSSFSADLEWWHTCLDDWNGISTLAFTSYHNKLALDASTDGWFDGSPGLGGFNYLTNEFFKCTVPPEMRKWHICDLELLAHIICCQFWGKSFAGLEIHGLTDNEACEWFLRNGRSRIDERLRMGRTITHLEHKWGFLWVPDGIRSKENVLPDCLSRWGSPERRATFLSTSKSLGIIPTELYVEPYMFNIDFRCSRTDRS